MGKKCTKCHKMLDVSFFRKDSQKRDGLYSSCVDCVRVTRGQKERVRPYRVLFGAKQRQCYKCKEWKKYNEYYSRAVSRKFPAGINNICKVCMRAGTKTLAYREYTKKRRIEERMIALEKYGGSPPSCACCGEKHIEFLVIDHIKGGGGFHRKNGAPKIYIWLKKHRFPRGFRVLCHNCNSSLGFYKYCPHKKL